MSVNQSEKHATRARLRIEGVNDTSSSVELDLGQNTIGRGARNQIQIEDPTISEVHCVLELQADGGATLRDLGSTNGTFVNGERIDAARLAYGHKLQFGDVVVIFEVVPGDAAEQSKAELTEPTPAAVPAERCQCAEHPGSRAVWVCSDCGRWLCSRCVKHIPLDKGRRVTVCVPCNGLCQKLEEAISMPAADRSYGAGLIGALGYPFQGTALALLVVATLFASVMCVLGMGRPNPTGAMRVVSIFALLTGFAAYGSVLLGAATGAYLLLFFREILLSSVRGDVAPPAWPQLDMDTLKDTLTQVFGWYLVCFAPLTVWTICQPESGYSRAIGIALLVGGFIYGLMALLAVTIYDNLAALNPLLIAASILRVPLRYLLLCLLVGSLVGATVGAERWLMQLGFPLLSQLAGSVLTIYGVMAGLRALGWFYRSTKDQLAWS